MTDASATAPPRRTTFEVEREKRWRIWLLFGLLLAMIYLTTWGGCLIVCLILSAMTGQASVVTWLFHLEGLAAVLCIALAVSLTYWGLVRIGARGRLLKAMHCEPLDPDDTYHRRLADIVEEMRLATGAPRVDCVTVPTVGLNAFAFSDLRGGGVVGVTEGALARLSRQELEGVVAQEFAHILSGGYVTVTVSCLLFGVYSSVADDLSGAVDASAGSGGAYGVVLMGPLLLWALTMQTAASVVNGALSRQAEWRADAAAARYTRDPLSLAEALRVIGRHPGGAGYIPQGLSPLCIRATGSVARPMLTWADTHPSLEARVRSLLEIANVSPAEFERQAAAAEQNLGEREHWAPAPGASPALGAVAAPMAVAAPALAASAAPLVAATPVPAVPPPGPAAAPAAAAPTPTPGGMTCPACGATLCQAMYEGLDIVVCKRCGGRLLSTPQLGKILARREAGFTDEQQRLADLLTESGDRLRREAVLARGRPGVALVACPRCAAPMMRRHYSYEHAVEVDLCARCDLTWFDKDELEALQILVERQVG